MAKWPKVKLADCVNLLAGFPFKSQQFTEKPDDVPLVKGENVSQGCILWDISKRWLASDWEKMEKFHLLPGDVVVAMDHPWVPDGLKWAFIREGDPKALLVQRCARLRSSNGNLDQSFLRFVIGGPGFERYVIPITTGVNVPHISGQQILDFEFMLPPVQVQQRIAGILSAYDELIENTPPPAPVLNSAVAGDGKVTISWTAVTGATSYKVYYTGPGFNSWVQQLLGNVTSYTISSLVNMSVTGGSSSMISSGYTIEEEMSTNMLSGTLDNIETASKAVQLGSLTVMAIPGPWQLPATGVYVAAGNVATTAGALNAIINLSTVKATSVMASSVCGWGGSYASQAVTTGLGKVAVSEAAGDAIGSNSSDLVSWYFKH